MSDHELRPSIMEPGPHILHKDGERWAMVEAEPGDDLWCPYCGEYIGEYDPDA